MKKSGCAACALGIVVVAVAALSIVRDGGDGTDVWPVAVGLIFLLAIAAGVALRSDR